MRKRLFGTDGVRGVVGRDLNPEMALRLGRAIGAFFGRGSRVLVGRDVRAGGDMIASAVISGLLAEGVKVYYAGLLPTPALQFSVRTLGYDGGVMVTASHNPPEYNGVKVIATDGIEVDRDSEAVIEEHFYSQREPSRLEWRELAEPVETRIGLVEHYVNSIVEHVDREVIARAGFRVVVDCGNSVGALATPLLLRKLGAKALSLNCHMDPEFPGREPEPTPDSLREAAALVRESRAELGVAHDGDADRAIFIDEKGRVLWGDRSGAILAVYAASRWRDYPRVVFTGVSSSLVAEEHLRKHGIEVRWTPVGSIIIARSLKREGGIAGFEENGGYIHAPFQLVRDGAMATALMLEALAREKRSLSSLAEELPEYHTIKTKIPAVGEMRECAVRAVKERYRGYRMIEVDGVKAILDKGWVLVRPSGTEPVVRIVAEGRTKSDAEELLAEALRVIEERCLEARA
ncbi:MAG: phosphoglucosamine mutase [Acidilobaceae archaeon]